MNRVFKRAAALTAGLTLVIGCGSSAQDIPTEDVQSAILERIRGEKGTLRLENPSSGEPVDLSFERVHESVKRTPGGRFVACVDFLGPESTVYDVDYFVRFADGEYRVADVVMHKAGGESVLSADERAGLESAR